MNKPIFLGKLLLFSYLILFPFGAYTQITSVAESVVPTEYASGLQDNIHIFCVDKGEVSAMLIASYPQGETGNFEWQKYNPDTGSFDFYTNDQAGNQTSTITNLGDGCYRVIMNTLAGLKTYTAWVFNNYLEVGAEITDSNCSSFTLKGNIVPHDLVYVDLTTKQPKILNRGISVNWTTGNTEVSVFATFKNLEPPTKNTTYTFIATDRFGCKAQADVEYISLVTKASFTYELENQDKKSDPNRTEAPLTVTFTNNSENADAGKYAWYFFKDLDKIKEEIAAGTFKDSIQDIIYSDNVVYTYEASGIYNVRLVSKKTTGSVTCTSAYDLYKSTQKYIEIDTSFIDAPNVFTPNGDGSNDKFAVKFFSMKTIKFTIFNRWGKVLHTWESNNVQGFYNTATTIPQAVWDGKVGGRLATPGVYFWVAEGVGRDGKKRKGNGFFHLFRDN